MHPDFFKESGADFSSCEKYRYRLWRRWEDGPSVAFVMLNPSTADATHNDPTIERCHRRAVAMGFGALEVVNIFAFRATDPKDLKKAKKPVGPQNDTVLLDCARRVDMTICAWGSHGDFLDRGEAIRHLLKENSLQAHILALTKKGHPRHPLYIPYSTAPSLWKEM